jgi:hypothetical protein
MPKKPYRLLFFNYYNTKNITYLQLVPELCRFVAEIGAAQAGGSLVRRIAHELQ